MTSRRVLVAALWMLLLFITNCPAAIAQQAKKHKSRFGSIYFSWGYNQEWYTQSTVHISQGALGNNYDLIHVNGRDHLGWDDGVFNKQLTIPQYNYRLGYYFNKKQDLAIEANFDHTKYLIRDMQEVHIKGTLHGRAVDSNFMFSQENGDF